MTIALDRLERAEFIRREHSGLDRRSIMIEITTAARRAIARLWQPIATEGHGLLEKYSEKELDCLVAFSKITFACNRNMLSAYASCHRAESDKSNCRRQPELHGASANLGFPMIYQCRLVRILAIYHFKVSTSHKL